MTSRLSPEDQHKVDQYLDAPQHRVQRPPFRAWRLMLVLTFVVIALGLLSRFISRLVL
ncbi:DUF3094 family protein [Pseudomonas mangiferae]|uniref:DUF3094 domain-containing protein n=1 Tax=Pseudomonas mangiferae TaxID=2593654 RepID=A0A553H320_9PSED|nr:DUF3094 family protein [Pseudomonas mangiferae]TRX76151.1 DUF3094 domain-containing protein [Pseudomonas mangiferae]